MRKAKLSIDEQIEHMKTQKGILFNIVNEDDAKKFLSNHNYYFRIKAYAKNYDKYINGPNQGKYIKLEFAYLQELSTLDMYFRKLVLKMTIDIEHFLKTQLLRDLASNEKEDGYDIVQEYLANNSKFLVSVDKMKNGLCRDLINKYRDDFALWNIIEVMSFGDFMNLYKLYYTKYPSKNDMSLFLWSVRSLRNAAAHNNCLLNGLKRSEGVKIKPNLVVLNRVSKISGIGRESRKAKMTIPVIHDFVVTLHLFNQVISSEKVKIVSMKELKELVDGRFSKNGRYFWRNVNIRSSYDFLKKVVDDYHSCVV